MNIFRLLKVFLGKVGNKMSTSLSILTKHNFTKPDSIYYLISNKCNFRCPMCDQWKMGQSEKPQEYLSSKEMKSVVDQAAAWGIKSFGISGGEPLIFKDRILELLSYANKKKMYTHFVTNGWLLDEETIREYDKLGGGHISLSLDALSPMHDDLRGVPGAFERVMKAIKAYEAVKPKNILLKINLVISNKNLDEVLDVVEMTKKVGASIFVQPYDPYNWETRKKLSHKEYHENYPMWVSRARMDKLKTVVDKMIEMKKKDASLIINSLEHLQAIPKYFSLELNRSKCYVAYRSLVIGPFGEVSVCKYGDVGNVRKNTIKEIWKSDKYNQIRKSSVRCNFDCLLGCMYDPSILSWIKAGVSLALKKSKK